MDKAEEKRTGLYDIRHIRTGYHGTGFAFHFVRCANQGAFVRFVKGIRGIRREKWFDCKDPAAVPGGFSAAIPDSVLGGVIFEAAGSFVCDVYIVVDASQGSADGSPALAADERRVWYHEIGHAVAFVSRMWDDALAGKGAKPTEAKRAELPAYANEFLCETLDMFLAGRETAAVSGFADMF